MISYEPLFQTLEEKGIKLFDVEKGLNFSPTITAKFRKNEYTSLRTLEQICLFLDVPIEKVVKITKE